jgi:uncharacterized protein YjiS (DUF1127 family)
MSRSTTLSRPLAHTRRGLLPRLLDLIALRRQRHQLRDLPPQMLRDIGLTEDQARAEACRPLWDVPPHWRG